MSKSLEIFRTDRTVKCDCGAPLDACGDPAAHGIAPEPGDFTVCVYCGQVYKFDSGGIARIASDSDVQTFRSLDEYRTLVNAVHTWRRNHRITVALRHAL